jgi:predicted PurR-regulated permease PerM
MGEQIEHGNGKVVYWLITIALLIAAVMIVWQFIPALLWAGVLSVLLFPWYRRTQKKLEKYKSRDTLASLYVTLFTAFIIIVPLLGFLVVGSIQVYNMASKLVADTPDGKITLHNLATEADITVVPFLQGVGINDFTLSGYIEENKSQIVSNIYKPVTDGAKRLIMMIVTLVIALLTTFFMLRDGHKLLEPVVELMPLPRENTIAILQRMATTISAVFYSVIGVAIVQGLICLILYWILGVPNPLAWWAITTIFAMIPLVGAPVGYIPAALLLLVTGHTIEAIVLLLIGFFFVSQIDNFLRPMFIKMGTNLHMIAIFFALLGGVFTLGPIGLMVGPMLLTLILGMLDVLRERRRLADSETAVS